MGTRKECLTPGVLISEGEEPNKDQTVTRGPTSPREWEPGRSVLTPVGLHHHNLRDPAHVASNLRTHITKGLGVRQARGSSKQRDHRIKKVRNPTVGTSGRQPGAARLWDLGRSELTPEGPHHETVSNTAVGTSEQKAHIPMGMGTWQECPCTT